MKLIKILLLAFVILLTTGASSEIGPKPCSAGTLCYNIANRVGSAGLACPFPHIEAVFLNGRPLLKGATAEYYVQVFANHDQMVVVHIPPNTTGVSEMFVVTQR